MKIQGSPIGLHVPMQTSFRAPLQLKGVRDQLYSAASVEKPRFYQRFFDWLRSIAGRFCFYSRNPPIAPSTSQVQTASEPSVPEPSPVEPVELHQLNFQIEELRDEHANEEEAEDFLRDWELRVNGPEAAQLHDDLQRVEELRQIEAELRERQADRDEPQVEHDHYGGRIRRLSREILPLHIEEPADPPHNDLPPEIIELAPGIRRLRNRNEPLI